MAITATFSSGTTNPTGISTDGAIYLNKSTGVFFRYDSIWNEDTTVAAYYITAWQSMNPYSPYASTSTMQYRQEGVNVVLRGKLILNTSLESYDLITTDKIICKFPPNYLPSVEKYVSLYDTYGGLFGIGKIDTSGDFTILGTKIPINNNEIVLDGITYEMI